MRYGDCLQAILGWVELLDVHVQVCHVEVNVEIVSVVLWLPLWIVCKEYILC